MIKSLKRSLVIILILIISVLVGYVSQLIWNNLERKWYPREYSDFVERYASEYGVPEYVIYSVIKVESNYQSNAVSHAGAVGLMQITPETFDWIMMLLGEELDRGMLYDPETNIKYGTYLLSYLYTEFGIWDTVFAAYNAGMARIKGWLKDAEYSEGDGTLSYIPIEETREYVPKINKAIEKYKRLYEY